MSLKIIEELHIDEGYSDFYRYRCGDFVFWFSQSKNTGFIFDVKISDKKEKHPNIHLYAENNNLCYPQEYRIGSSSFCILADDVSAKIKDFKYCTNVLNTIREFLNNSKHYDLYKKYNPQEDV